MPEDEGPVLCQISRGHQITSSSKSTVASVLFLQYSQCSVSTGAFALLKRGAVHVSPSAWSGLAPKPCHTASSLL